MPTKRPICLYTDTLKEMTVGDTLPADVVPDLDWAKITTGKPTTLAGYGITDPVATLGVDEGEAPPADALGAAAWMDWRQIPPNLFGAEKTAAYQVVPSDHGKVLYANHASGFTVTLPAAADCWTGWGIMVKASGAGPITLACSGADTLDAVASVTVPAGSTRWVARSSATAFLSPFAEAVPTISAFIRTLLDDADAATARATLGVPATADVQPYDADLTALAGVGDGLIARTGAGTAAARSLAVTGNGLSVTNADGVAGNPTIASNGTAANTPNTLIVRDVIGNFSAGTIAAALAGNASTATKLATARTLAMTGDLTWTSPAFDGSADVTAAGTLATVNANVGSFGSATQSVTFTVNGKGLVTAASAQTMTPAWGDVTGKPTTLAGYGITDAVPAARTVNGKALSADVTLGLASTDFANQGTTTTVLHGNAAGAPAFGPIVAADFADATITYAKLQNVSATDRILGRSSAGAGVVQEITCTATARTLLDDTSITAMRNTLGLGTANTVNFGAVGYGAGAGGTVTQATSKATGVTLNKICGQITTFNDALAAATTVSFVVTNSLIAAADLVIANIVSGGTVGAYTLTVSAKAAGSFTLSLRNESAGALSESVVIGFAIIKGATA